MAVSCQQSGVGYGAGAFNQILPASFINNVG